MKQRISSLLLALCMLMTAMAAFPITVTAATEKSYTCGENVTAVLADDGTLTIRGTGAMYSYSSYSKVPWYGYRANIKKVVIESGVTTIGEYAFYECFRLTSVTIPDSVTTIEQGAFYNCSGLTNVTIPDGVTRIGDHAFGYCSSLTNITIPASVTTIEQDAFSECYRLTSVTIPNSVTTIESWAFWKCTSLTKIQVSGENPNYSSLDGVLFNKDQTILIQYPIGKTNTGYRIPDSVTDIGVHAFAYCDSLTGVTIPNSVTTIGRAAFSNCHSLTDVTIPDSVITIGERAFEDCYSLTNVTIGDSVTTIGGDAFYNCTSLTSVTIGNSVTTIGSYAFYHCTSLTNITIPDSVTTIGSYAFYNCTSLTSVTIGNSVTTIGSYAFYNCTSLTSVTIGNSVTTIGRYAFAYCDSLTSVTIGNSVTTIGDSAFCGCSSLTGVTIPDSVTTIERDAFEHCNSLKSVTIPDSVITIGGYAFRACTSLTSVTIGNSITTIGSYAFLNCTSLTSVTIPDSVTTIGSSAFSDCDSLTNITIPDSVTIIENDAFSDCDSLTSVTIPFSVITIEAGAFGCCSSLTAINVPSGNTNFTSVDGVLFNKDTTRVVAYPAGKMNTAYIVPDSVTTIGDYAFEDCDSLTNINIPDSVTTIGFCAFRDCDSLTSVTIGDSVTTIGDYAFLSCDSLTSVTIGNSVTTIRYRAFDGCRSLTDVYYSGTQEQWNRISIGLDNTDLTNANIHYNYGKYEPTGDIAVIIPNDSGYMPEAINTITINGKGTAYGRFQILKSDGSIAKRVRVPYSVDSGFPQAVTTDDYGYATVAIGNITESRDYTVTFFGNGIQSKSEVMHVTVEPLHFKSGAEVIFEKGIQLGIGVGSEYEIGDLKASAGIFGLDLVGTCKNTFSFDYEYKNQKNAIELVSKSDYSAALEAKLGLFAEAGEKNLGGMEVALPKITGDAGAGIIFGAGYEDEDFNPNDPQDMDKLSRFLLLSVAGTAVGNVTSYIIAQMVESPVNTYQLGTVFKVNGGVKAMETEAGAPNLKFGGTIGGFDRSTVWSSLATMYEDGSLDYAASVDSGKGGELFQAGYKIKGGNDSAEAAFGADFYDNFAKESLQVTAETDPDFKLEKLSISSKKTQETSKLHKTTSTSTVNTITYDDQAAKAVAASYDMIDDFTKGEKAIFNKKELFQVLDKMSNSNQTGTFTTKQQKEEALSFHLPLKLAGFGLEFGVEGAESYDYVSESGIWENGTAYIQAKNDIQTEVEANTLTFDRILGYAEDNIDVILNSIFEAAVGMTDEALAHGQATLQKIGDKVSGFVAKIVSPKSKTKAMSILTVEDEAALFSTSSLAVTVGDPYIISVEDADGNELTDFSEHPMLLTLQYTTEQLISAGVSDLSTLSIVRWDEEKGVYANQGGTLDTLNACVTLEITKPGQYLLAVDNCPPAITQFDVTQGMNPQIRAIVSDMSSISEFQFSIDDTILLDQSNFEEHYRHATGEFYYATEGLPAGEHTATIYAKDSFGNEITEAVSFTVDTLTSAITNVTVIPEIISEEVTVSAEVSDANLVLLNAEVTDAYGETVQYSVDMTEENGVYSANLPDIENGSLVAVWVSACTPSGNSSASEKQQAIVMKSTESEPVIVITNVSDNKVHVKCAGFDSSKNQTIYLGLYSANGKLLQIQSAKPDEDVIFSDVSSSGYVRAFIWENTDPVCKATKPILFVPDTETEND